MGTPSKAVFEQKILPAISKGLTEGLRASDVDVIMHWVSYGFSWDIDFPNGPRRLVAERQSRRVTGDGPNLVWRTGIKGLHAQIELYPTQSFLVSQAASNPGLTIRAAAALWVARVRLLLGESSAVGTAIAAALSASTGLDVQSGRLAWPPDGTPRAVLQTPARTVREEITTQCPSSTQAGGFLSLCTWNTKGEAQQSASAAPVPSSSPTPTPSAAPNAPVDVNAPGATGTDPASMSAVVQTPLGAALAAALATIAVGLVVGIILVVRGGCRNSTPSSLPAHGGELATGRDGSGAAAGVVEAGDRDGLPPGVSIGDLPVALPVMVYQDGRLVSYDRARHGGQQHGVSHQHPVRLQQPGVTVRSAVDMADIEQSRRLALASHSAEVGAGAADHHASVSYAQVPTGGGRFAFEPQAADQAMAVTSHGFMAGHLWPQEPAGAGGRWPRGMPAAARGARAYDSAADSEVAAVDVHAFMRQARGSIALHEQEPSSAIGVFSVTDPAPARASGRYRAAEATAAATPEKRFPGQMPQMGSYMSDDAGDDSFTGDAEELSGIMGVDTPTGDPVPFADMAQQSGRTLAARRGVDRMTVATASASGVPAGGAAHGGAGASYDEMNLASMASTGEEASPGPAGWSAAARVRGPDTTNQQNHHQRRGGHVAGGAGGAGGRGGIGGGARSGTSASHTGVAPRSPSSRPRQEALDRGLAPSLSIEIDGDEEGAVTASRGSATGHDDGTSAADDGTQPAEATGLSLPPQQYRQVADHASGSSGQPLRATTGQWPPRPRGGTAGSGVSEGSVLSTVRAAAGVDSRTTSSASRRRGGAPRDSSSRGPAGPSLGVWARRGCATARSASVAHPVGPAVTPGAPSPHGRAAAHPARGPAPRPDERQFNSMASLSDDDGASIM